MVTEHVCFSILFAIVALTSSLKIVRAKKVAPKFDYPLDEDFRKLDEAEALNWTKLTNTSVSFLQSPRQECDPILLGGEEPLGALVLVKTAPGHRNFRNLLRNKWFGALYRFNMRGYFVLGRPNAANNSKPDRTISQLELVHEQAEHGDLIQVDFDDRYQELTTKTIACLNWFLLHCGVKKARFLIMFDDDYIVNLNALASFLHNVHASSKYTEHISGLVRLHAAPVRDQFSVFYLSEKEYPWAHFPPYPNGGTMIVAAPLVRKLWQAAPYVKKCSMEDVWVGILLLRLRIKPKDITSLFVYDSKLCISRDCRKVIGIHTVGSIEAYATCINELGLADDIRKCVPWRFAVQSIFPLLILCYLLPVFALFVAFRKRIAQLLPKKNNLSSFCALSSK